jgi:pentose-5-phosphate-3-epimerase
MKICPAILTDNMDFFNEKLRLFQVFDTIDIDFISPGSLVQTRKTAILDSILNALTKHPKKVYKIHLMCDFPFQEINRTMDYLKTLNLVFIIHQESSFNIEDVKKFNFPIGIAIKYDSPLKDLEYYQNFFMAQVMSIDTGSQGGEFKPKALERVKELRDLGYDGEVALDGGINLETIKEITKYPVDSLSVGSYFSKSLDVIEDKRKLERAIELNLKNK